MAFPTISFKFTNAEIDSTLREIAQQKFQTLAKFIKDESCLCEVEFEKMTAHQNGNIFRVEANLQIDGALYRADAALGSFEKSIDEVRDELDKKLRRTRKKEETLFKKGGRKMKEMLRFGK